MSSDEVFRIKLPLEWQQSPKGRGIFADTSVGRFNIHEDPYLPRWFVQLRTENDVFCEQAKAVESVEAGKTLAEAWYVERMRDGLVPDSLPSLESAYVEGWIDGNDHIAVCPRETAVKIARREWEQSETRKVSEARSILHEN
jgi:hypothetical protein